LAVRVRDARLKMFIQFLGRNFRDLNLSSPHPSSYKPHKPHKSSKPDVIFSSTLAGQAVHRKPRSSLMLTSLTYCSSEPSTPPAENLCRSHSSSKPIKPSRRQERVLQEAHNQLYILQDMFVRDALHHCIALLLFLSNPQLLVIPLLYP